MQVFSDGKLTVCDGAVVDVIFDTYIETGFLSTDNNQIKGTGTQFNSDRLFVSNAVEAELDITGRAVVNVEDLTSIGDLSAGKLLVSSPATTLNSGRLDVGFQGTGDLDIQLGAKVFAKQIASIGTLAGATGAVSIQGQDSELVVLEEAGFSTLAIGELGTGSMLISLGGRAQASSVLIAGGATVADPGSQLQAQDLLVDDQQFGRLSIWSDARVDVSGTATIEFLASISMGGSATPQLSANVIVNNGLMDMTAEIGPDVFGDVENNNLIQTADNVDTWFHDDFQHNGVAVETGAGGRTRILGNASGIGPYTGPGEVEFVANVRPGGGDGIGVAGIINIDGMLDLGANANLNIELGGTVIDQNDRIFVDGDASIDGDITVSLINGFMPSDGDAFPIVVIGGTRTGLFNFLGEGDTVATFGTVNLNITYSLFGGNDIGLIAMDAALILGDVNGDGLVNLLDVEPFVDLISSGGFNAAADINMDGVVNLLDVGPFIELLSGN